VRKAHNFALHFNGGSFPDKKSDCKQQHEGATWSGLSTKSKLLWINCGNFS